MNHKQRIQQVIRGWRADRVPTGWCTHFFDPRDNTVADQIAWARATDMDLLTIGTDGYMEYDCGQTNIGTPEGLLAMRPHKAADHYISGQVDRACRIVEGLKDGPACVYSIFTPFSTIKHSTGNETRVMELLREVPDAVRHAMSVIEENNLLLMERLSKEAGLDGIAFSLQNNEIDRFSREEYAAELRPWDQRLVAAAKRLFPMTVMHLCAWRGVPNRVEDWRDYECDIINWACNIEPDLGLSDGRRFFHPRVTVMGGFDNRHEGILHWGNESQIKAYTRRLIDLAGSRRLILGADCSIPTDTPPEHLKWVAEASEAYMREQEGDIL